MNREIKFRGKLCEWVEETKCDWFFGFYFQKKSKYGNSIRHFISTVEDDVREVYPDTVGHLQFN